MDLHRHWIPTLLPCPVYGVHYTDPSQIWWKYDAGSYSNDWSGASFDEDSVSSRAITRFTYDATTNNLTKITKPRLNEINISYGTSWKSSYIIKDYRELDNNIGGTTQYVVTSYDYDIKGRLTEKIVRFKSDTNANDTNLYSYGNNATKSKTQYTYDGMDRLLTKAIGDGTTQTSVLKRIYKDVGDGTPENPQNPYTIDTDYLGFRVKSYYDSRYRLISVEKYKPNQDEGGDLDYDPADEVKISSEWNVYAPGIEKVAQAIKYTTTAEDAAHAFTTKNSYDSIGRLTKVEVKNTDATYQGDGVFRTLREISYDERLNAVVTKNFIDDSSGDFLQTRVENDWLGRGPVKEISWTGLNGTGVQRITISHYRHDGKMIKRELPNKEAFLYAYDNLGRLEKITYPDGKRVAMMYDLNGNLAEAIDRRNLSTAMSYNKSDMVVNRTTVDAVRGDTVVTTTYTQFGPAKILQKENNVDIVENDYWYHWSGGVLKQQQIMDTHIMQIDNTYDAAGNRITTTPTGSGASPWTKTFDIIPQFHPTTPDTDNFNRIAVADDSTGDNVITIEPDFLGLTKEIKYGDYDSPIGRMSLAYDKYLRLAALHSNEGTRYLDITLFRDFVGNIIRRQEPALSPAPAIDYEYEYDGMDRLSSGEGETETYDELSNLVTKGANTYQYQDPDEDNSDQMRLAKFNNGTEHAYTYDDNGNPTTITNKFTTLSYDSLNMLRQIIHAQTDNYWYNQDGLRVKKTENAAGTWKTTYTLYEGDNILMQEQYDNSGRLQVVFNIIVNGQILAQYKRVYPSTDSVVYFYLDYLGSRRVVMNSGGTVLDRYRYSAWGTATQDAGTDDYRSFTGKDYEATGLIYFNARYYDPMTGRFLTEDPARKGGNWYVYCGNNPVNAIDPDGKQLSHYEKAIQKANDYNQARALPFKMHSTFNKGTETITATIYPIHPQSGGIDYSKIQTKSWRATNNPRQYNITNPRARIPNTILSTGRSGGQYLPQTFPNDTWDLRSSKEIGNNAFGPRSIPTTAHQNVPLIRWDRDTGRWQPTGQIETDYGYEIHGGGYTSTAPYLLPYYTPQSIGMGSNRVEDTTLGCIRMSNQDIIEFAGLSDLAILSGNKSTMTVVDR